MNRAREVQRFVWVPGYLALTFSPFISGVLISRGASVVALVLVLVLYLMRWQHLKNVSPWFPHTLTAVVSANCLSLLLMASIGEKPAVLAAFGICLAECAYVMFGIKGLDPDREDEPWL